MFGPTPPLALGLAMVALVAPVNAQQTSPSDDAVAAIVDGTEIYRSDVEAVASTLPEQLRQIPFPQLYGMLLDRAIDFRLLADAAENQDLTDRPDVQAALAKARADVLRDAYVRQRIQEGTTDERLRARYEELKDEEGFAQEEVHARHILVASEDEAKKVIAELAGGADFAALAKDHSIGPSGPNGGDLGFFRREQMVPEFAEAAFALESGQHTQEPVQTQFGWHVIEVIDRRIGTPSFEESEPRLRQEVAREIVTALVTDLRDDAEIERFNLDGTPMQIAPEAGPETPEGAPEAETETE